MFLTKGPMPHERLWRKWFQEVAGLLPTRRLRAAMCPWVDAASSSSPPPPPPADIVRSSVHRMFQAVCSQRAGHDDDPIVAQHLFSVYVHAPPTFAGALNMSVGLGRRGLGG